MTTVRVPDKGIQLTDTGKISQFLQARGIWYAHRSAESFLRTEPTVRFCKPMTPGLSRLWNSTTTAPPM